ncbi:MAG TPA: hypothetical protein VIT44_03665 [Cyclobacteriaceae bacterium]
MKQLQTLASLVNRFQRALSFLFIMHLSFQGFSQKAERLERMPESLETDFALSSLPPQPNNDIISLKSITFGE